VAQVAQRSGGCPIPEDIQSQAGWGSEQPDVAVGVPVHCGGGFTRCPFHLKRFCHYMKAVVWGRDGAAEFGICCPLVLDRETEEHCFIRYFTHVLLIALWLI